MEKVVLQGSRRFGLGKQQSVMHLLTDVNRNARRHRHRLRVLVSLVGQRFFCQIHADLAIVPPSAVCGKPNAAMVNLLRQHLLQVRASGEMWS